MRCKSCGEPVELGNQTVGKDTVQCRQCQPQTQASAPEAVRLNSDQISTLLDKLANQLAERGVTLNMVIVGGAAIALDVNPDREATLDIDVFATLSDQVAEVIREIAAQEGLPLEWINANAQQFMSPATTLSDLPIQVQVQDVTIRRIDNSSLLAMKLRAGRVGKDFGDIEALVRSLGVISMEQAQAIFDDYYDGEEQMKPTSFQLLQKMFQADAYR